MTETEYEYCIKRRYADGIGESGKKESWGERTVNVRLAGIDAPELINWDTLHPLVVGSKDTLHPLVGTICKHLKDTFALQENE
jgi:endonuclease YncB( thermonuclease family)